MELEKLYKLAVKALNKAFRKNVNEKLKKTKKEKK